NKDEPKQGKAEVKILLTDDPADYDAVYVDIQGIEIHSDAEGWISPALIGPGVYNLLDLSNGLDTLLVDAALPAGNLSQMRLLLGPKNSVVVEGIVYPLSTPSAQQSGLKFNIHQNLDAGGSYKIWIDFDAARSIVEMGTGNYSLKPVIRAYTELTDGRLKGFVLPFAADPVVYAIMGTDTAITIPDSNGFFLFSGLPEATYHVWMDGSEAAGFDDVHLDSVQVNFGAITDLGSTTLPPL